jgi:hypothetical protein
MGCSFGSNGMRGAGESVMLPANAKGDTRVGASLQVVDAFQIEQMQR